MDYTLIHYDVNAWEGRAYDYGLAALRAQGLPVDGLTFDAQLVMRGLIMDKESGNLIKVDRFGCAACVCARFDDDQARARARLPGALCVLVRGAYAVGGGAPFATDAKHKHPRHNHTHAHTQRPQHTHTNHNNANSLVKRAMHGTRMLSWQEIRDAYGREVVNLRNEGRWVFLNTLFSVSEAVMYMQVGGGWVGVRACACVWVSGVF